MTERAIRTLLAMGLAVAASGKAGAVDEATPELYAAAIRHAARAARCTAKSPCCFSVDGRAPSRRLVTLLSSRSLKSIRESGACVELTLDARRLSGGKGTYELVNVASGPEGAYPLAACTYSLRRTPKGWKVEPSETVCPIF